MSELGNLRKILLGNGYPENFIMKYGREGDQRAQEPTVAKLKVSLTLPFKGDEVASAIGKRLKGAVERTYPAASLRIFFGTKPAVHETRLDRPSSLVTSNIIYQFDCACSRRYIGRTERRLSTRISEHIPRNLALGGGKLPNSSIARHLLDSNHQVDSSSAFKIIFKHRNRRILRFAEAAAIRRFKPDLCKQLDFVTSLALPW
jgi:hypothetical protein